MLLNRSRLNLLPDQQTGNRPDNGLSYCMENIALIAACLTLGAFVRRFHWLPDSAPLKLNQFVIYVSLPAVILLRIPQLEINQQLLLPMFLPWLLIALSAFAVWLLGHIYQWPNDVTGCLMMVVPLGNTSYLGFPMVKVFFGDSALPIAIIFDQIGNFFGLAIYGSIVIAHYSGDPTARRPLGLIKRIISFPPFLALCTALLLKGCEYPQGLSSTLTLLSLTMVPMTMFLVGLQLNFRIPGELKTPLKWGLFLKLVAMPTTAAIICYILGFYDLSRSAGISTGFFHIEAQISIFEAAMPPMVTAGVLAIAANLAPRLAAAAIGLGLLTSCLSLPLLYGLLQI